MANKRFMMTMLNRLLMICVTFALSSCAFVKPTENLSLSFCDVYEPVYKVDTEEQFINEATYACKCLGHQYITINDEIIDCVSGK